MLLSCMFVAAFSCLGLFDLVLFSFVWCCVLLFDSVLLGADLFCMELCSFDSCSFVWCCVALFDAVLFCLVFVRCSVWFCVV